jgi:hypothetical protein
LTGRRCVVVGGGEVGLEKVEGLLACDARVVLVAPEAVPALRGLAAAFPDHERVLLAPGFLRPLADLLGDVVGAVVDVEGRTAPPSALPTPRPMGARRWASAASTASATWCGSTSRRAR